MLFDIIDSYDDKTIEHLSGLWKKAIDTLLLEEDKKKILSFLNNL